MVVSHFGVFDDGSDGLKSTLECSIWCRTTQKEYGPRISFAVDDDGILDGGSRFKRLAEPLVLPAGFQGSIVSWGYNDQQRAGKVECRNQPYPANSGDGLLRFVGTSRSSQDAATYPQQKRDDSGGCFQFLAGTFKFRSVPARSDSAEQFQKYHASSIEIQHQARVIFDKCVATSSDSPRRTKLLHEASKLLRCSSTFAYVTSKDRRTCVTEAFNEIDAPSTLIVADGLLNQITTTAEALSLLGPHDDPMANLEDVEAVRHCLCLMFPLLLQLRQCLVLRFHCIRG